MSFFSGPYELNGLRRLDPQVIGAVYDSYYPEIYRFVRYRVDHDALSGDITSQVFIQMIEATKSGNGPQTTQKAWLLRIAAQLVAGHLRHSKAGLTEEQQNLLALRFGQGYALEETAGWMQKNIGAMKQLQFRALAALDRSRRAPLWADDKLYDALEVCLQSLAQGADIQICLTRFPSRAAALLPLLETALQARAAAVHDVPVDAMRRGRAHVLRRAAEMRERDKSTIMRVVMWLKPESLTHSVYLTLTSVTAVTVLATGGNGLTHGPASLLPAHTLYPAKTASLHKALASPSLSLGLVLASEPALPAAPQYEVADVSETVPSRPGNAGAPQTKQPAKPPKPANHPGSGSNGNSDNNSNNGGTNNNNPGSTSGSDTGNNSSNDNNNNNSGNNQGGGAGGGGDDHHGHGGHGGHHDHDNGDCDGHGGGGGGHHGGHGHH